MKIFLKDGRILIYNKAENIKVENGMTRIIDKEGYWVAQINLDIIERIDGISPCSIKQRRRKSEK